MRTKNISFFNVSITVVAAAYFAFIILVLLTLASASSWHEFYSQIRSSTIFSAILISLETSLVVVLLSFFFGLPVAYLLALKNIKGKSILDTLLDLPIVMPPLVSGLGLLILLGGDSMLGRILAEWNINVVFTKKGIIIAQLFVAGPFFIKIVREAIGSIPENLLAASATLGASPIYTFTHVILPLCKNSIWAGLLMTWARALGEFGATAMVAGCVPGQTETMTVAIYMHSMSGELASAISIALLLMSLSFFAFIIFKTTFKQK
ncbi:ABC transporter permease [Desulfovulcanus sp.]